MPPKIPTKSRNLMNMAGLGLLGIVMTVLMGLALVWVMSEPFPPAPPNAAEQLRRLAPISDSLEGVANKARLSPELITAIDYMDAVIVAGRTCRKLQEEGNTSVDALRYLNLTSAAAAGIASALWFYSAVVRVKFDDTPGPDGMTPGGIVDDDNNDILASQARANMWSAWAACAAGVAAALQALVICNTRPA